MKILGKPQKEWPGESEERLRAFIEHAPRKMWISRVDGTTEFFNREWRDYTGIAVADGALPWREVVHPDDLTRVDEVRESAVARLEPYDVQARLRRASDGAYRWHIGRVAPVHLRGTLIAWIGAATDIDRRIRAEAALRDSEASFRTMADAIPHVVWMRDPHEQSIWLNRVWFAFTGMVPEQVPYDGWRTAIHPDHLDAMMDVVHAARTRGEPWEFTAPLRRADGHYCWFLFRGVPIRDRESGRIRRWFGTGTDVHEQQETQERQRLMTQEVSHRVKNSLALVAGQLSLQMRTTEDGEARKVLMDAYSRVQTIASVHDHLWRQYDARITELSSFLRDLCRKLQETAPDHEVIFTGSPTVVPTDQAVPIGLVINELVTNALKYAYPEGSGGSIQVDLHGAEDGSLMLEVVDRGAGMPEGFDLFAPTKSLGIRLIVNTIRQLNASVTLADAEPGTRFEIRIPAGAR